MRAGVVPLAHSSKDAVCNELPSLGLSTNPAKPQVVWPWRAAYSWLPCRAVLLDRYEFLASCPGIKR